MKIYNLLTLSIAIYASKKIKSTFDFNTPVVNSIKDGVILAQPNAENIAPHQQEINYTQAVTNNLNIASSSTITAEDEEIDRILDIAFFSVFKRAVSFFLYNITILKPIFISIYEKQKAGQLNIEKLNELLFKHSTVFKINLMRELFKTEESAYAFQIKSLKQCYRGYLNIRNLPYENLTYDELKKNILNSNPRFSLEPSKFTSHFNDIKANLFNFINEHLNLDAHKIKIFLGFSDFIHDLVLNFDSTYRLSFHQKLSPDSEDYKALFSWAINAIIQLSNSLISEHFVNPINNPFPLLYNDIQFISGFVIILFKIVQTHQANRFFPYSLFFYVQRFLSILVKNSSLNCPQTSNYNVTEKLTGIFIHFLNEVTKKKNELKKFEEQTGNYLVFQILDSNVIEFFKTLIKEFGYNFSPNSWTMKKDKKPSQEFDSNE